MGNFIKRQGVRAFGLLVCFLCTVTLLGQARDEYGEVNQTVARISLMTGDVSLARGDDRDNWQPADLNVPLTLGDRLYTGARSRVELQVHGGQFIRLGARTDLAALNLTEDTKQFSLKAGVVSFQIRRLAADEIFEVDTPTAALTFERPGDYRVDVDSDGNTRVTVRSGQATVAAGGGQVALNSGEAMDIAGFDVPRYDVISSPRPDAWDRWVEQRESRLARANSYRYVSEDIVGADDLDDYGRWQDIPEYGRAWSPTSVAVDWAPYRAGHWMWQDPWGWTWVSLEPWGWAPYHYGRWVVAFSRWYWVPVAPQARYTTYSPALVAFVGGGPGWSASASFGGGGFVGWFPLGPRDPFVPWWGRQAGGGLSVTNVTFVNRPYMTVVNRDTFVSGASVTNNFVRDQNVVRQIGSAPILRGPIPVVPTAASLRVAARANVAAAPRPPMPVVERAVVSRMAPPPAPPSFQEKLTVIRQNRGAPVVPAEAEQMSVQSRGGARSITTVRPVAQVPGRMTLSRGNASANSASASSSTPQPVAPVRGRQMATTQQPVAPSSAREIAPRRAEPSAPPVQPPAEAPSRQIERERARPPEAAPRRDQPVEPTPAPKVERERARPPEAAPRRDQPVEPTPAPKVERERARPPEAAPRRDQPVEPTPAPKVERERARPPEAAPRRDEPQVTPQPPERGRGREPTPTPPSSS